MRNVKKSIQQSLKSRGTTTTTTTTTCYFHLRLLLVVVLYCWLFDPSLAFSPLTRSSSSSAHSLLRQRQWVTSPLRESRSSRSSSSSSGLGSSSGSSDKNNNNNRNNNNNNNRKFSRRSDNNDSEKNPLEESSEQPDPTKMGLKAVDINNRLRQALDKMKERDCNSKVLQSDDIQIAYQDEHIIIVDKPAGVLSSPPPSAIDENIPALSKTVYNMFSDTFRANNVTMEQMVVHRLGMDTSGLIVFGQTIEAVRGMHTMFRSRQVVKQYEALVCGHVKRPKPKVATTLLGGVGSDYSDDSDDDSDDDTGIIQMPLMRDYERPPYMRISTRDHQRAIASLDEPRLVHKKFLEAPKSCITQYQVLKRGYWTNTVHDDSSVDEGAIKLPVTRLTLTSISGRTHQLNVHCAAMGHPIVADTVYGWNGEATPRGGLELDNERKNKGGASLELQKELYQATSSSDTNMCIHATFLSFRHPVTKTMLSIRSPAPF